VSFKRVIKQVVKFETSLELHKKGKNVHE